MNPPQSSFDIAHRPGQVIEITRTRAVDRNSLDYTILLICSCAGDVDTYLPYAR